MNTWLANTEDNRKLYLKDIEASHLRHLVLFTTGGCVIPGRYVASRARWVASNSSADRNGYPDIMVGYFIILVAPTELP
jgi:hypothetical protein